MTSLGETLREARERQGLTLEGAEASTMIRKSYLKALEEEDYAALPHPTYVKGFLKTYATFLGLDPEKVLHLYPHRDHRPALVPVARLERPRLGAGFWVAVVALLVLVSGLVFYLYSISWVSATFQRSASPAATEEVPPTLAPGGAAATPSPVVPLAAAAAPMTSSPTPAPPGVEVRARATARSWICVAVDSTPVFTGTLQPGQEITWVGKERVFMRAGNAGGLVIVHNGLERGVLGGNGQVLDVQWTRDSMSFDINTPSPCPR